MERDSRDGNGLFLGICFCLFLLVLFADPLAGMAKDILWQFAFFEAKLLGDEALLKDLVVLQNEGSLLDLLPLLDRAGQLFAIIAMLCMLIGLSYSWSFSCKERYRKTYSMADLLRHNVRLFPALSPILAWEKSLLLEPLDSGPWMTARQPLQFAAEHALLYSGLTNEALGKDEMLENGLAKRGLAARVDRERFYLNRDRAAEVFRSQFGPLFTGFFSLPAHLLSLALAFALFGLDKKEASSRILHTLAKSFRPPQKSEPWRLTWHPPFILPPKKGCSSCRMLSSIPLAKKRAEDLLARPEIREAIRPHNQYVYLVLLALYAFARKKGVLSSAEFIWLKPMHRTLFYLLNTFGRRTVWAEAAGPWMHYKAEAVLGERMPSFCGRDIGEWERLVEPAVDGLERALQDEGWLFVEEAEDSILAEEQAKAG